MNKFFNFFFHTQKKNSLSCQSSNKIHNKKFLLFNFNEVTLVLTSADSKHKDMGMGSSEIKGGGGGEVMEKLKGRANKKQKTHTRDSHSHSFSHSDLIFTFSSAPLLQANSLLGFAELRIVEQSCQE
jgi:hypothetical protein